MNNNTLPKLLTTRNAMILLFYLAFVILAVVSIMDRNGAPLLPINKEIDSVSWVLLSAVVVIGLLAFIVLGFPLAFYKIARGDWLLKDVGAGLAFTLALALLLYVPVSYVYENSLAPRKKMHSHLQLFPDDIPDTIEKDEDTIVIAFLGGSTTAWGEWTDQVAERLQAEFPDRTFVVLNQGVQWYTVLHSLINYESNVRHVKADIVVVMHAINDLTVNADRSHYVNGEFRRDYGHHTGPLARIPRIRPLFDVVADVAGHIFFYKEPEVIEMHDFKGLPVFKGYYERLVDLIRLDGAQPVVMAQPYLYKANMPVAERAVVYMDKQNSLGPESKWSLDTARRGMEQFVEAVREISVSEQVPLIDLEAVIPKDLVHLKDDCHYTEEGAALVAENVANGLAQVIRASRKGP